MMGDLLMMATIWTMDATYMVFLYPMRSIRRSETRHPRILPIHGKEFIKDLREACSS